MITDDWIGWKQQHQHQAWETCRENISCIPLPEKQHPYIFFGGTFCSLTEIFQQGASFSLAVVYLMLIYLHTSHQEKQIFLCVKCVTLCIFSFELPSQFPSEFSPVCLRQNLLSWRMIKVFTTFEKNIYILKDLPFSIIFYFFDFQRQIYNHLNACNKWTMHLMVELSVVFEKRKNYKDIDINLSGSECFNFRTSS